MELLNYITDSKLYLVLLISLHFRINRNVSNDKKQ